MTWYLVHCKLCNNDIMVGHKTEMTIICPFCRHETMEYEKTIVKEPAQKEESTIDSNVEAMKTRKNRSKRLNNKQTKKLLGMQEQIRADAQNMKIVELVDKYGASYPVIKKIISGTWQPKIKSK